jgi:hypothetical protein
MDTPIHASTPCSACGLPEDLEFDLAALLDEDDICPCCDGSGGDPLTDFSTPCEYCGGEGRRWWL